MRFPYANFSKVQSTPSTSQIRVSLPTSLLRPPNLVKLDTTNQTEPKLSTSPSITPKLLKIFFHRTNSPRNVRLYPC